MFALCFLTKSWHAMVLAPIVFFYLVFTKGFKRLKWWRIALFFLIALTPILIWAIFRFMFDGIEFFKGMIEYDLLSRSSTSLEGHNGSIFYYVDYLLTKPSVLVCLVVIICYLIVKIKNKSKLSYFEIGCIVAFLSVFIIFTISKTKLSWYIYPCFIPLALFTPTIITNWLSKLSPLFYINLIAVLCLICSLTIQIPLSIESNEMQGFINSVEEVYSIDLYIETENSTRWSQSNLLCAELKLDAHCLSGGIENFKNDEDSYIILSASKLENLTGVDYQIIYESNNILLCKHSYKFSTINK